MKNESPSDEFVMLNQYAKPISVGGGTRHVELFGRLKGWRYRDHPRRAVPDAAREHGKAGPVEEGTDVLVGRDPERIVATAKRSCTRRHRSGRRALGRPGWGSDRRRPTRSPRRPVPAAARGSCHSPAPRSDRRGIAMPGRGRVDRLGLTLHPSRDVGAVVDIVVRWARRRGVAVVVRAEDGGRVPGWVAAVSPEELVASCDAYVSIGGDGNMLGALRMAVHRCSASTSDGWASSSRSSRRSCPGPLDRLAAGDVTIEPHSAMSCTLSGDELVAFNDAVPGRHPGEGFVTAALAIDGRRYGYYRCDALIVSTRPARRRTATHESGTAKRVRAFSRPLLAAGPPDLLDYVTERGVGYTVPPRDVDAAAEALRHHAGLSPEDGAALEQRIHRAGQELSWRVVAARIAADLCLRARSSTAVSSRCGSEPRP